jgi:hypothetical protein
MTLLDIFPIRQRILGCLGTRSVLRLMATSRTMCEDFRSNECNINPKLSRFVNNPFEFRSQLGRSNGLIFGSFVLQFFECVVWPESNLDIIVPDKGQL